MIDIQTNKVISPGFKKKTEKFVRYLCLELLNLHFEKGFDFM